MGIVRNDNEENATLCVKIISEQMRHQQKVLSSKAQSFLTLIQELFDGMERAVREQLDSGGAPAHGPTVGPSTPGNTQTTFQSPRLGSPVTSVAELGADPQQQSRPLLKGMQSFKVISECPITVVSLFQVHRNIVPEKVKQFVPLIKNVLMIQAKAQQQAHEEAASRGTTFSGVSPLIRNRAAFGEFVAAQVKTMSFLAYVLRQYSQHLHDFLPHLPDIVVRLLKDCPREKSGTRKELLVAIRHIINFNFRKPFLPKIDELLEERTLIGDGLTVYDALRPLAYSMLADLIHHVRDGLNNEQIRKTVEVYTKNVQDTFLGPSFQTMSAKLLLNMAECIARMDSKADARHYLIMILNAIGDKFASMNRQYENAVKVTLANEKPISIEAKADNFLADKENLPSWDEIDIFNAMPIKTSNPREKGADPVADNRFLFRNLMTGLKNTFYQLKMCNPTSFDPKLAPAGWQDVAYGFTAEEVQVIIKLFREGAHVFRYYDIAKTPDEASYASPVEYMANIFTISSTKEEKELLETFATVFHCIDPAVFHEVFQLEIPRLYDMIFDHTALLYIPQFFLASEATSPSFCGMLLQFLMERIDEVGSANVKKSSILLRLFKLAFMAVDLFASQNEQVLMPHIVNLVTKSIELSTIAEEPMNYFLLLRSLFRSIGGGKFDQLYKLILPLLEMLLDVLNNLLMAARRPADRDLYVELCLTVPARLSNLLPHLSYLMRPLVVALRAGAELVGQGLRTLELCVDNLTADYLDPIMAPVVDDLMTALFDHLQPHPYNHFHAHTTMRILGKLGGRNRKFMADAPPLNYRPYADDASSVDLRLIGSKHDRAFPIELGIDMAIRKLKDVAAKPHKPNQKPCPENEIFYKRQAFDFVKAQIKVRIGPDNTHQYDLGRLVRLHVEDFISQKSDSDFSAFELPDRDRSMAKKYEQDNIMKRLLKAVMFACSLPEFKEEAEQFLFNVCSHFTLVEVGRSLIEMKHHQKAFDQNAGEGPMFVDTRVLASAIIDSLASHDRDVRAAAQGALKRIYDSATAIMGSTQHISRLPFLVHLATCFTHACYEEEWFTKAGGVLGIRALINDFDLGDQWIKTRQPDFIRGLLYVIKDMPSDLPENTRSAAQQTLESLLSRVTQNIKREDVVYSPSLPQPGHHQGVGARPSRLAYICMILNTEIGHVNKHVRLTARRSLEMIAKAANVEVWELIHPYKERLLQPIFSKPLRALPFATQIAYIDAVTYCMGLKSDYIPFDENLNRLLMESLALADASDESLANKPMEFRTNQYIVTLRVSCIRILSVAMGFEEFMKSPPNQTSPTRAKIISVFFKCLYSESKLTIQAANDALKAILRQTQKLPKDLLQTGLRPVLANLQEPKRLTVHGIENLARLLRLLTTYFKVEIGARLLDHVKVLADPNILQAMSFKFFEQENQMKVVASVFDIFYLLPEAAEQFKERLIDTVLDLEEKLRRTHQSPFREPLYCYLNKYPKEVWTFLVGRIDTIKYGRFLAQVLRHPASQALRDHASVNIESLISEHAPTTGQDKAQKNAASISMIKVVHSLCQYPGQDAWITKKEIMGLLKQTGKTLEQELRKDTLPVTLRLAAHQAEDHLIDILVKSLEKMPGELEPLFSLIESVTAEELRETNTLFRYIYQNIISSGSVELWRKVVLRCLDIYSSKTPSQKLKWWVLHYIVNPIVAMDVQRNWTKGQLPPSQRFLDKSVIDSINTRIWKVNLPDPQEDLLQPRVDHTRMEVLQLTAMLVKYHHNILQDARKDIIKFGWTYIRLDDIMNKNAAYVVIGYFIAHYETPGKIVSQVYFSLLKSNANEGRALVTQALELMAPVLPKRCQGPTGGGANAVWAVAPRRILAEEGQNAQQMQQIFYFLVRHPNLFYETRDKFAMLIITSLKKVAPSSNPSNESRKLALHMMWLIWLWEKRRVEGLGTLSSVSMSPSAKRKIDANGDQPMLSPSLSKTTVPSDRPEYVIPVLGRQRMVRYLIEFIAQLNERFPVPAAKPSDPNPPQTVFPTPSTTMVKMSLELLCNLLQPEYWGDLDIELPSNVIEYYLRSDKAGTVLAADPSDKEKFEEKFMTGIVNTLQAVRIILNYKSDDWILKNMSQIQTILEKCLKSENPEIQDCLHYAKSVIKLEDAEEKEERAGKEKKGGDKEWDSEDEVETTQFAQLKSIARRILDALPEDVPMEDADAEGEADGQSAEVTSFFSNIAAEALNSGNYVSSVNLLWSLGQRKPAIIDQHIQGLMKALQTKLARDHVHHYTALANAASNSTNSGPNRGSDSIAAGSTEIMSPRDLYIQTDLLIKALQTINLRMETLGDNRRPFLSVTASLTEKSLHNKLCKAILNMVKQWIFQSDATWPNLKEKTAVLHKMLAFEARQDLTMLSHFLKLVIEIYEDSKVARTELTVRMEHAFLIGTRAQDVTIRNRFMTIFDRSLSKTASSRIAYVVASQNWDTLAETFWLAQASQLLLGAVENGNARLHREDFRVPQVSRLFGIYAKDKREPNAISDDRFESFIQECRQFLTEVGDVKVRDILDPLGQLQHVDSKLAKDMWVELFPMFWTATLKEDRAELERGLVKLLTKDYHARQLDKRPNVVQALLDGAARAWPSCKLPYHVLKFQARQYDTWYTAIVQLEKAAEKPEIDTPPLRESCLDALTEMYVGLQEDDMFYGLWRRRCQFVETNSALSYEQNGMWDKAQRMYESAQVKARSGAIPFCKGEYELWEDHWVLCAQKLQQWDILQDFAKHENIQDLLLECVWRNTDGTMWTSKESREAVDSVIKGLMDAPTPRRNFFQAFMGLLKYHESANRQEAMPEFQRLCDEAIQLSIRKWHQLPQRLTNAHVPFLQMFQQLVELQDASVICNSLSVTTQANLDVKSNELKLLLGTWRDRLPNPWDDITAWQDLVTWRQHIFNLINSHYLTLLPPNSQNTNGASFAYRGYHETAWIINRFAHVARKHNLSEVCINQLSRIYTLPNIEIQEAFLKLREQAKCHYENPDELSNGLDVINNTNLAYFSAGQKAQFYTLKGMFLEKMKQKKEADAAFGGALQFDVTVSKAWAEWAHFHDRNFKANPQDLTSAKQALTCYLQAAGSFKNAKSRNLVARIIWLLSLDDAKGTIASGIDDFKGEIPVWYWITFIPQLLTGLGHKEAPRVHSILLKIAKTYPQALYFQLRTTREDMNSIKKTQEQKEKNRQRALANATTAGANKPGSSASPTMTKTEGVEGASGSRPQTSSSQQKAEGGENGSDKQTTAHKKAPWELTEEIMSTLKSSFPLLALSMETMVDQIQKYFKCPPDEDAYRLIVALLNDGLQYVNRTPTFYSKDVKLPSSTETNITRFAESILPHHIRPSFEAEFVKVKPTMYEYIHKLRKWRNKFEEKLDRRVPQHVSLESYSPNLSEFRYTKFDEVEIPGQYLQHKDKNTDFVRIDRFLPTVDLVRSAGASHRRLKIRGHDGSVHSFAVQHPAARHCRREERILQLFRQLNQTLGRKKESRRRDIHFTLPLMVPLAPHIRIVQEDTSYVSLQGIYEDHCRRNGMSKDEPIIFTLDKLRSLIETKGLQKNGEQSLAPRLEVFNAIQQKWVPQTVVLDYFQAIYTDFADFWLFRRRFSYQFAALSFMTYVLYMHQRYPHKMHIARKSGNVWGSDLMSAMATAKPVFYNSEPVPFRLTPNLHALMGPVAAEGIFTASLMAIARCLTEPEHDELEHILTLFVRDEMIFWYTSGHRGTALTDAQLRESVQVNSEMIVKRAVSLAQAPSGNLPANQTVIDTINKAVNPLYLAQMDVVWMPYV